MPSDYNRVERIYDDPRSGEQIRVREQKPPLHFPGILRHCGSESPGKPSGIDFRNVAARSGTLADRREGGRGLNDAVKELV